MMQKLYYSAQGGFLFVVFTYILEYLGAILVNKELSLFIISVLFTFTVRLMMGLN